jgi:hypothetical protein
LLSVGGRFVIRREKGRDKRGEPSGGRRRRERRLQGAAGGKTPCVSFLLTSRCGGSQTAACIPYDNRLALLVEKVAMRTRAGSYKH